MTFWSICLRSAASLALTLAFSGCLPTASNDVDEAKDPHYINGRAHASSLDYKGAVEEFEKALETNPRNAKAHYEAGLIYGEQMKDYATAIYHLQQHLRLRPNSEYIDQINGRLKTYKSEFVKNEYIAPQNIIVQRDLERLTTENMMLKKQIELLQTQLATRQVLLSNSAVVPQVMVRQPAPAADPRTTIVPAPQPVVRNPAPAPAPVAAASRSYIIKSGDTITTIARDHGIKINNLLKANPDVDPRRLRVGQALNLPAS